MSTFKLVAKGEVLAGHEVETVKAKIARLFKLEPDSKQLAAIFSGRPLRLRGGFVPRVRTRAGWRAGGLTRAHAGA